MKIKQGTWICFMGGEVVTALTEAELISPSQRTVGGWAPALLAPCLAAPLGTVSGQSMPEAVPVARDQGPPASKRPPCTRHCAPLSLIFKPLTRINTTTVRWGNWGSCPRAHRFQADRSRCRGLRPRPTWPGRGGSSCPGPLAGEGQAGPWSG